MFSEGFLKLLKMGIVWDLRAKNGENLIANAIEYAPLRLSLRSQD